MGHRLLIFLSLAWSLAVTAGENPKVGALAREGHWQASGWAAHGPMLGQAAPRLELSGWAGGELSLDSRTGKILVVDFWATWCGPCLMAIPHNNQLARKYADRGVLLLGACGSGRGEEKMAYYAELLQLQYPTAIASPATTAAWKVQWWPTYAVVDRNGILRALGLRPDALEGVLDALLEEQPGR